MEAIDNLMQDMVEVVFEESSDSDSQFHSEIESVWSDSEPDTCANCTNCVHCSAVEIQIYQQHVNKQENKERLRKKLQNKAAVKKEITPKKKSSHKEEDLDVVVARIEGEAPAAIPKMKINTKKAKKDRKTELFEELEELNGELQEVVAKIKQTENKINQLSISNGRNKVQKLQTAENELKNQKKRYNQLKTSLGKIIEELKVLMPGFDLTEEIIQSHGELKAVINVIAPQRVVIEKKVRSPSQAERKQEAAEDEESFEVNGEEASDDNEESSEEGDEEIEGNDEMSEESENEFETSTLIDDEREIEEENEQEERFDANNKSTKDHYQKAVNGYSVQSEVHKISTHLNESIAEVSSFNGIDNDLQEDQFYSIVYGKFVRKPKSELGFVNNLNKTSPKKLQEEVAALNAFVQPSIAPKTPTVKPIFQQNGFSGFHPLGSPPDFMEHSQSISSARIEPQVKTALFEQPSTCKYPSQVNVTNELEPFFKIVCGGIVRFNPRLAIKTIDLRAQGIYNSPKINGILKPTRAKSAKIAPIARPTSEILSRLQASTMNFGPLIGPITNGQGAIINPPPGFTPKIPKMSSIQQPVNGSNFCHPSPRYSPPTMNHHQNHPQTYNGNLNLPQPLSLTELLAHASDFRYKQLPFDHSIQTIAENQNIEKKVLRESFHHGEALYNRKPSDAYNPRFSEPTTKASYDESPEELKQLLRILDAAREEEESR